MDYLQAVSRMFQDNRPSPTRKHVLFFSVVYGADFIQQYKNFSLRSIFQTGNLPWLIEHGYTVKLSLHTLAADEQQLRVALNEACAKYLPDYPSIESDFTLYDDAKNMMKDSMRRLIVECINTNAMVILSPPDTFYGNYSISNIIQINMERGFCIAGLNIRGDKEKFANYLASNSEEISNKELARMTFRDFPFIHLTESNLSKVNSSGTTGIFSQEIGNGFIVAHRLPSVCLASFTAKDLDFFSERSFGDGPWDHVWPTMLMVDNRYKMIGSADVFISTELTPLGAYNDHPCVSPVGNDDYRNFNVHGRERTYELHETINRNFLIHVPFE